MVWDLSSRAFPELKGPGRDWLPWAAAVATTFLFFGSVLAHELAHSFAARRFGIGVSRITLFIFGGVAQVEDEPDEPKEELLIALAGPGMSVLLGLLFGLAYYYSAPVHWGRGILSLCLERVATVNLILAVFNMVPGFPMDGGRVLRSLLWMAWQDRYRATRIASILGQAVGYTLAGGGALLSIGSGSWWVGLFYVGMGLLLASVARSDLQREAVRAALTRAPLWQFAVHPELAFPSGVLLSAAGPTYLAHNPRGPIPVLLGHRPIGVISDARLRAVPPWQWGQIQVDDVMDPLQERMVLRHDSPAFTALERILGGRAESVLLVDHAGDLAGVVTEGSVRSGLSAFAR